MEESGKKKQLNKKIAIALQNLQHWVEEVMKEGQG